MEKKNNAGLYLKNDYKTRDADGTFTVGELWPHFLERKEHEKLGLTAIWFNILDCLNIFRTRIGGKIIKIFLCGSV